ncbi:MAG: hypothetical protein A2087_02670 [Spirochaetes bacterium GWD1_61_31]|nr:MAG: hypothetical protein A2Y37_03880 [Spirochaetes bacterium GWB1_60_80]OHD43418.1 MAG: hypothetical protein A2087_02670 [Spirochaetes bacterium GWD1_61_31]OHD46605.1 MAG: hypothetical protein A2Y35_14870 [Spirochaetes bacterium GWE1_60_18]OHD61039.1 MAG: hypothetical protein A2Y32_05145 [Spirochaetes bacterium GWF1_60_12]
MSILLLCTSPGGQNSITWQYCRFFERALGVDNCSIELVGREPEAWQKNRNDFTTLVAKIKAASAVVFVSPVFQLMLPAQVLGLLGLLRAEAKLLVGKPVLLVTVSFHHFDNLAHDWFSRSLADAKSVPGLGLALGLFDLFDLAKRRAAEAAFLFWAATGAPSTVPLPQLPAASANDDFILCLVDDMANPRVMHLVEALAGQLQLPVRQYDLASPGLSSGCRACLTCLGSGVCRIPDAVAKVHSTLIDQAAAIVWCGEVENHFFSTRFKAFLDRWFFRGLQPILRGKVSALLTPSSLDDEPEVRQYFEAFSASLGARWAGVWDEPKGRDAKNADGLAHFAAHLEWMVRSGAAYGDNFLALASHKIKRDAVFALQTVLWRWHEWYRRNGLYDFPGQRWFDRLKNGIVSCLLRIPALRRRQAARLRLDLGRGFKTAGLSQTAASDDEVTDWSR